jgi:hypothetical protein
MLFPVYKNHIMAYDHFVPFVSFVGIPLNRESAQCGRAISLHEKNSVA